MAFLKPQNPMTKGSDYFYPLTTADQVIMDGGYRLNDIVGKVKKSTITLYANGWSVEVPHCYSVIVDGLSNSTDMKILPRFPEDFESKQIMREETAKISFASRNNNILTFECWDGIPTIDIPIDIEINILYPSMPDIQLNYSVVGGTIEPENPSENMIWINTENEITSHKLSKYEPKNPVEGMVWIYLGDASNIHFHTLSMNERELDEVYPLSVKQYISGAWTDVDVMIYQGGKWVALVTYLFQSGSGSAYTMTKKCDKNASITWNDDKITISAVAGTAGYVCAILNIGPVDITNATTLCVDMEYLQADTEWPELYPVIGIRSSALTTIPEGSPSRDCVKLNKNTFARKTVTMDISSYTDSKYIYWCGSGKAVIYNIWLE